MKQMQVHDVWDKPTRLAALGLIGLGQVILNTDALGISNVDPQPG